MVSDIDTYENQHYFSILLLNNLKKDEIGLIKVAITSI